jgi:predicted MFS family arabinose efflux permease
MASPVSERRIVFLVGAVQFINILDFMMVMPLGPDFARALGIPTAHLGLVAGSYTAAAAVAGLVGASFLDRFDRRKALAVALCGLVVGTATGAFARGLTSLVLARVIAGAFGGPATSVSLSIVADVVPPERRGRAMGAVMGAFSVASVLGVPFGLWLAAHAGWRAPFIAVASLGVVIGVFALRAMPSMAGHIVAGEGVRDRWKRLVSLLGDRLVRLSLAMNALVMMAAFLVVPNISAFVQQNLGYPRRDLDFLYMVGGTLSFFVMRAAGRAIDRFGPARVATVGTAMLVVVLQIWFVSTGQRTSGAVVALFVCMMMGVSVRNVSMSSLATRVPRFDQRAAYMSLQSTAQHVASSAGAVVSSLLLSDGPDGRLKGMPVVASLASVLALALPPLLAIIGRGVRAREAVTAVAPPRAAA